MGRIACVLAATALALQAGGHFSSGARSQELCDAFASPAGSDSNPGTAAQPFLKVQTLLERLQPGETGCLRGGTYSEKSIVFRHGGTSGQERVVLRSYPGEKATIRGQVKVPDGSDYITVRDLTLDGTGGPVVYEAGENEYRTQSSPLVYGDHTRWINLDVTKRNIEVERRYTGVCFLVGSARYGYVALDTKIMRSRVHNCGPKRGQPGGPDNHGIYLSNARGTVISGSMIYENGERGIQLYPDADASLIKNNIIEGNGQGILFSGFGSMVSSGNTVRNNSISDSTAGWNVYSNYNQSDLVGRNNVVRDNCLWKTESEMGLRPGPGFRASGNVLALPGRCPKLP